MGTAPSRVQPAQQTARTATDLEHGPTGQRDGFAQDIGVAAEEWRHDLRRPAEQPRLLQGARPQCRPSSTRLIVSVFPTNGAVAASHERDNRGRRNPDGAARSGRRRSARRGWNQLADVEMSIHGYIALALGVLATLGLGMGLMWLVYYSDRRGFDDEAGRD